MQIVKSNELALPKEMVTALLKPSITLKDGTSVSPKDYIDSLFAEGYGNPQYYVTPKTRYAGFITKPGNAKVVLNDLELFYADYLYMQSLKDSKRLQSIAAMP